MVMARGTKTARQLFVDHDSVTGDEDEEDDVPNSDDSDRLVVNSSMEYLQTWYQLSSWSCIFQLWISDPLHF